MCVCLWARRRAQSLGGTSDTALGGTSDTAHAAAVVRP